MPCVLFSVGRAVSLSVETSKAVKLEEAGQINRYKANDLAGTAVVFLGVFSSIK
ncbi:hypothetical protein [Legionella sp. PC997]|uniref:hypothetical protein n=1 Tax=Legionella sp. PC997 TaxID=2755562 RepID=UPI0015FB8900|nr:hypothetical protein [Legionella sp. PC997]